MQYSVIADTWRTGASTWWPVVSSCCWPHIPPAPTSMATADWARPQVTSFWWSFTYLAQLSPSKPSGLELYSGEVVREAEATRGRPGGRWGLTGLRGLAEAERELEGKQRSLAHPQFQALVPFKPVLWSHGWEWDFQDCYKNLFISYDCLNTMCVCLHIHTYIFS